MSQDSVKKDFSAQEKNTLNSTSSDQTTNVLTSGNEHSRKTAKNPATPPPAVLSRATTYAGRVKQIIAKQAKILAEGKQK